MINLFKQSVMTFLLLVSSNALAFEAGEFDWAQDAETKVLPKDSGVLGNGAVSFILGNGAVSFFPEASADELRAIEESVGIAFTVFNRFRVISTLVTNLQLNDAEYMASQKVPTQELLDLAQMVVAGDVTSGSAEEMLANLSKEYTAYVQYRLEKK